MARSNSSQMMSKAVVLACLLAAVAGQGLPVRFGLLPTGDLTTVDQDGPYAVPDAQAFEVRHPADKINTSHCSSAARSGVSPVMMLLSSWQRLPLHALTPRFLLPLCLPHPHHALCMTPTQVSGEADSLFLQVQPHSNRSAPCQQCTLASPLHARPTQPQASNPPDLSSSFSCCHPPASTFLHAAALAAKTGAPGGPFTDFDVLNFLANTECLEATFNTLAAFGAGLPESLKPGAVAGGK